MSVYYDYTSRLHKVINSRRKTSLRWGQHDCALFTADCVMAMTGVDVAVDYRGKYETEEEAMNLIGGSLEEFAERTADEHKFNEVKPLMAKIGDVVLFDATLPNGEKAKALGICVGDKIVSAALRGVAFTSIYEARRVWQCHQQ